MCHKRELNEKVEDVHCGGDIITYTGPECRTEDKCDGLGGKSQAYIGK